MWNNINLYLNFGAPLTIMMLAYFIGSSIERKHFASIRAREKKMRGFPVTTFATLPANWKVGSSALVSGSMVVSLDYFKRVIAGLRAIVGGRIKTYEPLLDRARREAVLRMLDDARSRGFDAVINVRLETARLANSRGNGQGVAGVEMLAFGTGITRVSSGSD